MDFLQETEIIKLVKVRSDLRGSCEIGLVAEEVLLYKISNTEKRRLAEKITESKEFHLEIKNSEFIIHKNESFRFETKESKIKTRSGTKKVIGVGVIAHAILLCGHFLLKEESPPAQNFNNIIFTKDGSKFNDQFQHIIDSLKVSSKSGRTLDLDSNLK